MNTDTTSLYQTLGVPKTCAQDEIKRAYRRLALIYHPDRANAAEVPDFETKFREIAAAYEILGDPKKREVYDSYGTMGVKVAESGVGHRFTNFSRLIQAILACLTFMVLLVILFFCFLSARIDKLITWDFNIVFIPLWILNGFAVIIVVSLIAVAASGILYDDKYDDGDIQEPMTGAERDRRRQQRRRNFKIIEILKSTFELIKLFALIAFEVLIAEKANDPSSIATPIVFEPYFAWEGLNFLGEFITMLNSTTGVTLCSRLTMAVGGFIWILTRMAFAILVLLRVDEHITYSWHTVCIPLYVSCVLYIIDLSMVIRGSGLALCMSLFFKTLIVVSLFLPLITMLAGKLDGEPYTASHVLIPIFVFLSMMFCFTGFYLPKLLTPSNYTRGFGDVEEARREGDRESEDPLLSTERQPLNTSYASTGSSTQLID